MNGKLVSFLLVLFFVGNIFITSCGLFFNYLKMCPANDKTAIVSMINFSLIKVVSKDFIDVCSTIGDMLTDYKNNDKTVPIVNQKETSYSFPSIFIDKFTFNNYTNQYKFDLVGLSYCSKLYSDIKKHIVDKKPDRTDNIFLLLFLQMLLFLIVLNMYKYYNVFHLFVNKITPSLLTV